MSPAAAEVRTRAARAWLAFLWAALLWTSGGCTTHQRGPQHADELFARGAYSRAIVAYQAYLAAQPPREYQDHALFQLALAHALAKGPPMPMAQTITLLERLIQEFPHSPYLAPARLILALSHSLASLRQDVAVRAQMLEELRLNTSQLQADLTRLEGKKDGEIGKLDAQLRALRQEIRERTAELRARQEQIERLTNELEALKRIDTGSS